VRVRSQAAPPHAPLQPEAVAHLDHLIVVANAVATGKGERGPAKDGRLCLTLGLLLLLLLRLLLPLLLPLLLRI
tara:strand:- start:398 stop:619 length:222 start_codon:yes stop_codon:yes gene_type:complete